MIALGQQIDELHSILKTFSEELWEHRITEGGIARWLANFANDDEKLVATHLLSQFSYFGQNEIRELLKALYRDLVRYPVIQKVRKLHGKTFDARIIEPLVAASMRETRFLGVGNPSESGTHLLYYFRQENLLAKDLFVNSHRVFERDQLNSAKAGALRLREPGVKRYVFIDDLCGSGTQAKQYSQDLVEKMLHIDSTIEVDYYCLFGLDKGIESVRAETAFTEVRALFTLDESFRCFSNDSRYYLADEQAAKRIAFDTMSKHGGFLCPAHPLGYKDGQLLLGFSHNIPDNTLPVIWSDEDNWAPIFRRHPKF